jgi:hypothetical protein
VSKLSYAQSEDRSQATSFLLRLAEPCRERVKSNRQGPRSTLFITECYFKQYRVPPESLHQGQREAQVTGQQGRNSQTQADRPTGCNSQTQADRPRGRNSQTQADQPTGRNSHTAGPTAWAAPLTAGTKPLNGPCGRGALLSARASASHGHAV